MNKISLSSVLMVALAGSVALAGCRKDEDMSPAAADVPAVPGPAPASAPMEQPAPATSAVNVTAVTVGNSAAADKSVAPMDTLGSNDKIIVSIQTNGSASNTTVAAKLTYQEGQVAGEQSATLNTNGMETTNIEFSKDSPWPAGKYRVDVSVDGQPAGMSREFQVK